MIIGLPTPLRSMAFFLVLIHVCFWFVYVLSSCLIIFVFLFSYFYQLFFSFVSASSSPLLFNTYSGTAVKENLAKMQEVSTPKGVAVSNKRLR